MVIIKPDNPFRRHGMERCARKLQRDILAVDSGEPFQVGARIASMSLSRFHFCYSRKDIDKTYSYTALLCRKSNPFLNFFYYTVEMVILCAVLIYKMLLKI